MNALLASILWLGVLVNVATGAMFRTPNFVVTAADPQLAEAVAKTAESARASLALWWFGSVFPDWSQPCQVRWTEANNSGGGSTSFAFDRGEVFGWEGSWQGRRSSIGDVVGHEVMHTLSASFYRRPIPRWIDEGLATACESAESREFQKRVLFQLLRTGRGIPIRAMIGMAEYPRDPIPLYAQGWALTEYLLTLQDERTIVRCIADSFHVGQEAALAKHYGKPLDQLANDWLSWVRQGMPTDRRVCAFGQFRWVPQRCDNGVCVPGHFEYVPGACDPAGPPVPNVGSQPTTTPVQPIEELPPIPRPTPPVPQPSETAPAQQDTDTASAEPPGTPASAEAQDAQDGHGSPSAPPAMSTADPLEPADTPDTDTSANGKPGQISPAPRTAIVAIADRWAPWLLGVLGLPPWLWIGAKAGVRVARWWRGRNDEPPAASTTPTTTPADVADTVNAHTQYWVDQLAACRQNARKQADEIARLRQQHADVGATTTVDSDALHATVAELRSQLDDSRKLAIELRALVDAKAEPQSAAPQPEQPSRPQLGLGWSERTQTENRYVPVEATDRLGEAYKATIAKYAQANPSMAATLKAIDEMAGHVAAGYRAAENMGLRQPLQQTVIHPTT